jgi:hypothetical protein
VKNVGFHRGSIFEKESNKNLKFGRDEEKSERNSKQALATK